MSKYSKKKITSILVEELNRAVKLHDQDDAEWLTERLHDQDDAEWLTQWLQVEDDDPHLEQCDENYEYPEGPELTKTIFPSNPPELIFEASGARLSIPNFRREAKNLNNLLGPLCKGRILFDPILPPEEHSVGPKEVSEALSRYINSLNKLKVELRRLRRKIR